ncbi:unnamed protein product [Calypogeia fissa]
MLPAGTSMKGQAHHSGGQQRTSSDRGGTGERDKKPVRRQSSQKDSGGSQLRLTVGSTKSEGRDLTRGTVGESSAGPQSGETCSSCSRVAVKWQLQRRREGNSGGWQSAKGACRAISHGLQHNPSKLAQAKGTVAWGHGAADRGGAGAKSAHYTFSWANGNPVCTGWQDGFGIGNKRWICVGHVKIGSRVYMSELAAK